MSDNLRASVRETLCSQSIVGLLPSQHHNLLSSSDHKPCPH